MLRLDGYATGEESRGILAMNVGGDEVSVLLSEFKKCCVRARFFNGVSIIVSENMNTAVRVCIPLDASPSLLNTSAVFQARYWTTIPCSQLRFCRSTAHSCSASRSSEYVDDLGLIKSSGLSNAGSNEVRMSDGKLVIAP